VPKLRNQERTDRDVIIGEAGNGIEAVAMAAALMPDVILMDVNMPEIDGIPGHETDQSDPAQGHRHRALGQ